jgi:hypothetical protein
MANQFFVYLPSNTPKYLPLEDPSLNNDYPNNRNNKFRVRLPKKISFNGSWVCGLHSISYPYSWPSTVGTLDDQFINIHFTDGSGKIRTLKIPVPKASHSKVEELRDFLASTLKLQSENLKNINAGNFVDKVSIGDRRKRNVELTSPPRVYDPPLHSPPPADDTFESAKKQKTEEIDGTLPPASLTQTPGQKIAKNFLNTFTGQKSPDPKPEDPPSSTTLPPPAPQGTEAANIADRFLKASIGQKPEAPAPSPPPPVPTEKPKDEKKTTQPSPPPSPTKPPPVAAEKPKEEKKTTQTPPPPSPSKPPPSTPVAADKPKEEKKTAPSSTTQPSQESTAPNIAERFLKASIGQKPTVPAPTPPSSSQPSPPSSSQPPPPPITQPPPPKERVNIAQRFLASLLGKKIYDNDGMSKKDIETYQAIIDSVKLEYHKDFDHFKAVFTDPRVQYLSFSPQLGYVLGWADPNKVENEERAKYGCDLRGKIFTLLKLRKIIFFIGGFSSFAVYSKGLTENVIIGNSLSSLLRVVSVTGAKHGEYNEKIYDSPIYARVLPREINEIEIELRTLDDGRLVPFAYGTVMVVLIFKKVINF